MKKIFFLFWEVLGFFFISCNLSNCNLSKETVSDISAEDKDCLKIVTWNAQTFFDAVTSGNEYSEFKKSTDWNEEKYKIRLSRLTEVLNSLNADVYVLEEIENEAVLYDIYNQCAGNSWDSSKIWSYGCFGKEPDSAIGIGVLSKLPLENLKLHNMDIRTQKETQPSGRPVMEVTVVSGEKKLTLFLNHWKSKVSGSGEGEIWRQWQECVLANAIKKYPEKNFLACGDFNKDISAFGKDSALQNANICLRGCNFTTRVYSPWLSDNGKQDTQIGSYYFQENWEKIDQFFCSTDLVLTGFHAEAQTPWADEDGIPVAYRIYTGNGYSDHLPLICNVFF